MQVSPIDYRYGRDEAKEIWSRDGRHSRLLEVERALVWAHCKMGKVSAEHYDKIADISDPGIVTAERVDELERETNQYLGSIYIELKEFIEPSKFLGGLYYKVNGLDNPSFNFTHEYEIKRYLKQTKIIKNFKF